MSLALVMIAVAVLPAALAENATCTGALMAVQGVPDKCFWYLYQDVPMGIQFLSNLCQSIGKEGRLFRPRSMDEIGSVQDGIVPQIVLKDGYHGQYPVDFFLYQQYNQSVWATLTYPFELMAPGMWQATEPNSKGTEKCVNGGNYFNVDQLSAPGLNDISCNAVFQNLICEFPSEN